MEAVVSTFATTQAQEAQEAKAQPQPQPQSTPLYENNGNNNRYYDTDDAEDAEDDDDAHRGVVNATTRTTPSNTETAVRLPSTQAVYNDINNDNYNNDNNRQSSTTTTAAAATTATAPQSSSSLLLMQSIRENEDGDEDDAAMDENNNVDPTGNHREDRNQNQRQPWWRMIWKLRPRRRRSGPLSYAQQQQILTNRLRRHHGLRKLVQSHMWHGAMMAFAVILLFGDTIRTLFLPPLLDHTIDVVFLVTILFFLLDIGIRCSVEDNYFTAPQFWKRQQSNETLLTPNVRDRIRNTHRHDNNNNPYSSEPNRTTTTTYSQYCYDVLHQCLTCGSFLFWCDFSSTMALLFDVTWINRNHYSEIYYPIVLDRYSIPVRCSVCKTVWNVFFFWMEVNVGCAQIQHAHIHTYISFISFICVDCTN
jgi:hypothetical protein